MSERVAASRPSLADIPAVILAGGLGTRLRSAVADRPKALALVAGRPFLAWMLDRLQAAGTRRVVLCTGYLGEMIQQTFGDRHEDLALEYSQEAIPLGTGGALRAALPRLESHTLLVLNGDSLCPANLQAFVENHAACAAQASLLLIHVEDTSRYGRVEADGVGRLTRYTEKGDSPGPGWINAGIYLLNRDVVESIPPQGNVSLEREVFPAWIGRGLFGHRDDAAFLDIGTPESYAAAAGFLAKSTTLGPLS